MIRCIDTYKEQGWEFVNKTFNGWYYFRKVYDPSLPTEEYELYTDRASLKAMQGRWATSATIISVMIALFFLLWSVRLFLQPCLPHLIISLTLGIEFFVFLRAVLLMRNPDKPKAHKGDCLFTALFFVALIVGFILFVNSQEHRPHNTCRSTAGYYSPLPAEHTEATQWDTLSVSYKDRYYLDLNIDASAPIRLTILSEEGKTVYTVKTAHVSEEDIILHLSKGEYQIYLSDFAGGSFDISYQFK